MTPLLQTVAFPERRRPANLVHVDAIVEVPLAVRRLGFSFGRPVMVVVGGAGRVSDEDLRRIERLFQEVLAPVADACGAVVVDGGRMRGDEADGSGASAIPWPVSACGGESFGSVGVAGEDALP
ncbi:MAG: hypothetical protein HC860_24490 [Alkalinema sp. RU_4_3]|nr:hypothetical protein [Alkalinema sp. RU_4_3]